MISPQHLRVASCEFHRIVLMGSWIACIRKNILFLLLLPQILKDCGSFPCEIHHKMAATSNDHICNTNMSFPAKWRMKCEMISTKIIC